MRSRTALLFFVLTTSVLCRAQKISPYHPDTTMPQIIPGMLLAWHDEFNKNGKPDPAYWGYEHGFVRNRELQWYQEENAICQNGVLLIEGRKENKPNPQYIPQSADWRTNRSTIHYTSASIRTQGLQSFLFGRFEIRARVDTSNGSWPAIWTLGTEGRWPLGGEIDIMEFYRVNEQPALLANMAWGRAQNGGPVWNTGTTPLADFLARDPEWPRKFHVWRLDWTKDSIHIYLDNLLLNSQPLNKTINPDGSNPFLHPQYLLLNLAIGGNGGDPSQAAMPLKYEVDYVRYYRYTE